RSQEQSPQLPSCEQSLRTPPPAPIRPPSRRGRAKNKLNIFNGLGMGKLDGRAALGKLPGARLGPLTSGQEAQDAPNDQSQRGRTQRSQAALAPRATGGGTHDPHRSGKENGRRRRSRVSGPA